MINESLNNKLSELLITTRLEKLTPDLNAIDEALSLNGKDLSNLGSQILSIHLYTLTQYVSYLQLLYNTKYLMYLDAKRKLEIELRKTLISMQSSTKMTVKEKEAMAFDENPLLSTLEKEMSECESEYLILNKMPDSFLELANSLKKELSIRDNHSYK